MSFTNLQEFFPPLLSIDEEKSFFFGPLGFFHGELCLKHVFSQLLGWLGDQLKLDIQDANRNLIFCTYSKISFNSSQLETTQNFPPVNSIKKGAVKKHIGLSGLSNYKIYDSKTE